MRQWAYIQTRSDAKDKTEAIALCEKIIPENLNTVDSLSINWSAPDKALKDSVLHAAGIILAIYSNVREALP
jgi:hypothetical protein